MQKEPLLPASISFGDDDIPSVMVAQPGPTLTDEELAIVALALATATSDSLDSARSTVMQPWNGAAASDGLRRSFGMKR